MSEVYTASAEDVEALTEAFIRLVDTASRTRQHFIAAAKHDIEWRASIIIAKVVMHGPLRASEIADALQADPSTISRQVATLVKDGFLERQADPVDGRASLLVATAKGKAAHREHTKVRTRHFANILAGWSERDIQRFTALLQRFADGYEDYFPQFCAAAAEITARREEN